MRALKVYLAGPDVFHPSARALGELKKALCARYGFEGLFPLDNEIDLAGLAPARAGLRIYEANRTMMMAADFGIAQLTPFRGPSADAGTVFEVGYLTALGKPVYGYSNEAGDYLRRARLRGCVASEASGECRDADDMLVEAFELADNLMILGGVLEHAEFFIHEASEHDRYTDLTGFEQCLRRAALRFGRPLPPSAEPG